MEKSMLVKQQKKMTKHVNFLYHQQVLKQQRYKLNQVQEVYLQQKHLHLTALYFRAVIFLDK